MEKQISFVEGSPKCVPRPKAQYRSYVTEIVDSTVRMDGQTIFHHKHEHVR